MKTNYFLKIKNIYSIYFLYLIKGKKLKKDLLVMFARKLINEDSSMRSQIIMQKFHSLWLHV